MSAVLDVRNRDHHEWETVSDFKDVVTFLGGLESGGILYRRRGKISVVSHKRGDEEGTIRMVKS